MILNMAVKVWIFRIYILCLTLQRATFQFTERRLCSTKCICMNYERLIICGNADKIEGIPVNVNSDYNSLTIQGGNFHHRIIHRNNLTGLNHLTTLKVIYCKLISVESRAFEDLKMLNILDLSHNNLQTIQPYSFSGLNLKELHLMENPDLKLVPNSFSEMKAKSINLRSNKISSVQFDIFSDTNFEKLYFYNNQITTIDQKFSDSFSRYDSLIDLTGNPLNCSCELKWLLPILKDKYKSSNAALYMKSVNFTCAFPMKLKNKEMKSLSVQDLSCPKARITTIIVALGIPDTELTCVAVGNNYRAPGVAWNYIEPDNARELRRTPLKKNSNTTENLQTSLSVKVRVTDKLQAFTCTSWFEENQSENIVVNIKAPSEYLPKNAVITTNYPNKSESKTNDIFRPIPEPHFIFKKQFTILEMIGAVVGTFIITLILLVMLAQILRWWKRGQKTEANYKSVNIIKPYWTLGHDSNNTYSHPISHTDYDIPRTYDTDAPSICQSPPLSRGEFLDYKTQNKIYST